MFKLFFVSLLLLTGSFSAASQDFNDSEGLESVHDTISEWIYRTSNRIDIFFSGNSEEVSPKSSTYLDTSFDAYAETYRSSKYRYNISLRLHLPRTQKKLNLMLEDFKKTSSVDLLQSASPQNSVTNNDYLLEIQYRQQESKYTRIGYGGGIRFRSFRPDPYVSLYLSRSLYFSREWELLLRNKTHYFADYKLDNSAEIALIKIISEELRFSFRNIYRFIEHENYRNEIVNTLALERFITPKKGLGYFFSAYSSGDTDSVFKLGYYYVGVSFRHYYYRDWAYYQIEGGGMLRESNNFSPSARVMFKMGFLFGRPDRLGKKFR